jgi:hypothetical protein
LEQASPATVSRLVTSLGNVQLYLVIEGIWLFRVQIVAF